MFYDIDFMNSGLFEGSEMDSFDTVSILNVEMSNVFDEE
jgi:hypothetical protein